MLTEEIVIDQVIITETGYVLVREALVVKRDGLEIARIYRRSSHEPGDSAALETAKVAAISAAVWTPEVIQAHEYRKAAAEAAADRRLGAGSPMVRSHP